MQSTFIIFYKLPLAKNEGSVNTFNKSSYLISKVLDSLSNLSNETPFKLSKIYKISLLNISILVFIMFKLLRYSLVLDCSFFNFDETAIDLI